MVYFSLVWSFLGLSTSWIWMAVSLSRLMKYISIMSSNIFSAHLSLFSPSGTPMMWILVSLVLSQKSLKLSSFAFTFFLFSVQLYWFPFLCVPPNRSIPLYHLFCCWILPVYFFISVILFFISVWFFFIFSNSVKNF